MEPPTRLGLAAKVMTLVIISFVVLYPFAAVVMTSLSTQDEITRNGGLVLFPVEPTLEAYRVIFSGGTVTRALLVSVAVTVAGTLASLSVTVAMAFALARRELTGGRAILMVALFTMLFSPGIIPNYLLVKELGLLNSFGSLILPALVSAFNLVVLRSFFMGLPQELLESARMDGAGDLRILLRIVLPLSKAVVAVVSLFYAVAYWNAFFNALLYLESDKWPLPLILRLYVLQGQPLGADIAAAAGEVPPPAQALQMAVVVVALVPILLVYPFLQRYFTKGVLTGAVKG
ncbi:carbohydrate ABC transporter permease [Bailinhaonella thermotolerans]|uniref:Carbohydrate ABC transporter permease n=2 Tax=Bailinhaonella thermotolerans TaxID=1070861 RepID=A0A3A4ATR2_9ACTN|nr:carbohydrate ABC transporter permease [Bailinhaonella thermotolerans]